MGFSSKIVKKTYAFLKPHSIEEATTFLSIENGKYQHNFYIDYKHKNFTKCYICDKPKEMHINNLNKIENIFEKEYKDKIKEEVEIKLEITNKEEDCLICNSTLSDDNFTENLKCHHRYCNECWTNYILNKINSADVINIKCMNFECSEILSDEFIKKFIKSKLLLDKYENFKLRYLVLRDPDKKFCPYPGCDSYAIKKIDNNFVKCVKNGHKFCFECLLHDWHKGIKCEFDDEKNFLKWKKDKFIKQCPNCHIFTEKNEGCNHMKCTECKYEWCWLCEQQYNYDHYKNGSCNGLQFFKAKNEEEIKKVLANPNDKNRNQSIYSNYSIIYRGNIDFELRDYDYHENNYGNINELSVNYQHFKQRVNCFYEFIIYFFFTPFVIYINYISTLDNFFNDNDMLTFINEKIIDFLMFFNLLFFLLYYMLYLNISLILHLSFIIYYPMFKNIKKLYFYYIFHKYEKFF